MDIDSPPSAAPPPASLSLPTFSSAFPLPFRVLSLIGLAIALWATNVHLLTALGLDVVRALDVGEEDEEGSTTTTVDPAPNSVIFDAARLEPAQDKMSFDGYGRPAAGASGASRDFSFPPASRNNSVVGLFSPRGADKTLEAGEEDPAPPPPVERPTARSLYRSVYALFLVYTLYVGAGWLLFRLMTRPTAEEIRAVGHDAQSEVERERMERRRAVVGLVVVGLATMGFGTGFGWGRWKVGERERQSLLRYARPHIHPASTNISHSADRSAVSSSHQPPTPPSSPTSSSPTSSPRSPKSSATSGSPPVNSGAAASPKGASASAASTIGSYSPWYPYPTSSVYDNASTSTSCTGTRRRGR